MSGHTKWGALRHKEPLCAYCGEPVDINAGDVLEGVEGYRARRTQGGQNHLRLGQPNGKWMHGGCEVRAKLGIAPEQVSLL